MAAPNENQLQFLESEGIIEKGKSWQDVLESLAHRLCRQIWPQANPDTTTVRSLGSGNFNVVLEIEINGLGKPKNYRATDVTRDLEYPRPPVDESALDGDGAGVMVLRIPRSADGLERTVAVLGYLKKQAALQQVPRLLCYDTTPHNPMGLRYVITSRIAGIPLEESLANRNLKQGQKLALAREVAQFYRQMQGVRSEVAGDIEADPDRDLGEGEVLVRASGSAPGAGVTASQANHGESSGAKFLVDAYERKLTEAQLDARSPLRPFTRELQVCLVIAQELLRTSALADDKQGGGFSLCHTDLFPRNVMVDPSSSSTGPVLTGVIDWDEAIFAPRFATCLPPVWLWQEPGRQVDEVERFGAEWSAADSAEHLEVKRAFEEAMGPEYARLVYEPEFVIARRLLKFARAPTWLWRDWYVQQIDEMSREWQGILNRGIESS